MPINLTAPNPTTTQTQYFPSFFHSELTGRGQKRGRINPAINPGANATFVSPITYLNYNNLDVNKGIQNRYIITNPIPNDILNNITVIKQKTNRPLEFKFNYDADTDVYSLAHNEHVKSVKISENDHHSYHVLLDPAFVNVHTEPVTDDYGATKNQTTAQIIYNLIMIIRPEGQTSNEKCAIPVYDINSTNTSKTETIALVTSTATPHEIYKLAIAAFEDYHYPHLPASDIDTAALDSFYEDYNAFAIISRQAEMYSTDAIADYVIDIVYQSLNNFFNSHGEPNNPMLGSLAHYFRFLETYQIPLTAYQKIFAAIDNVAPYFARHLNDLAARGFAGRTFNPATFECALQAYKLSFMTLHAAIIKYKPVIEVLLKQNLQLILNRNLSQLAELKDELPVPTGNDDSCIPDFFSLEQKAAATSHEPLVITQAGAGTGKSTTIRSRIDYLINNGVASEDITVISFTRVAAENIKKTKPDINSVTIDKLITDTYQYNCPQQSLSTNETLANTLLIEYGDPLSDPLVATFYQLLKALGFNEAGAMTKMANFIEKYTTEVISILNTVKQTTLELQIIISYILIDSFVDVHKPARHLIIDEVQDNSVFQFIYALRYAIKNKSSLFFVGDSSQTLYEFRSANPKALNALEASGIFASYRLTTNYRSNQEILDFANIHLDDIEANKYAQIQLYSSQLAQSTFDSFCSTIAMHSVVINRKNMISQNIPTIFNNSVMNYINDKLDKGEKVAILAHNRKTIKAVEEFLQDNYGMDQVINLTSDIAYNNVIFSNFIREYWTEITQLDPKDAPFAFHKQVLAHLYSLTKNADKARPSVEKSLQSWWSENQNTITSYYAAYADGTYTKVQYFEALKNNILNYEITKNNNMQSRVNQVNNDRRERNLNSDASLITSTIHGAKGMEFDNVIVIHTPANTMSEADKRMYYVAFTRAMKTEYIITIDHDDISPTVVDYGRILSQLAQKENRPFDMDTIEQYIQITYI